MAEKEFNFIIEARTQPDVIRKSLEHADAHLQDLAKRYARQIEKIVLVGCGDPHMLSVAAGYAFEQWAQTPAEPIEAAEFSVYRSALVNEKTLVILITSSGKTVKVIDAARLSKARGAKMFALTNIPGSPITEEVDEVMVTQAGRSDTYPTKVTTTALANLYALALYWAREKGTLSEADFTALKQELYEGVPQKMAAGLQMDAQMKALAAQYPDVPIYTFIGSGPNLTTAVLAAAKMKETSQSRSEACNLEEYGHLFCLSLKDHDPIFLLTVPGMIGERNRKLAKFITANGGEVIAVGPASEKTAWAGLAKTFVETPEHTEMFGPLVIWAPLQLFSYYVSVGRGLNPDRPADRAEPGYLQEIIYTSVLDSYYTR